MWEIIRQLGESKSICALWCHMTPAVANCNGGEDPLIYSLKQTGYSKQERCNSFLTGVCQQDVYYGSELCKENSPKLQPPCSLSSQVYVGHIRAPIWPSWERVNCMHHFTLRYLEGKRVWWWMWSFKCVLSKRMLVVHFLQGLWISMDWTIAQAQTANCNMDVVILRLWRNCPCDTVSVWPPHVAFVKMPKPIFWSWESDSRNLGASSYQKVSSLFFTVWAMLCLFHPLLGVISVWTPKQSSATQAFSLSRSWVILSMMLTSKLATTGQPL